MRTRDFHAVEGRIAAVKRVLRAVTTGIEKNTKRTVYNTALRGELKQWRSSMTTMLGHLERQREALLKTEK